MYFGRVLVTHFDQDMTVEIGRVIADALAAAGIHGANARVEWVHSDGKQQTTDAAWDGKRWVKPKRR
jgi:hypothetical protein